MMNEADNDEIQLYNFEGGIPHSITFDLAKTKKKPTTVLGSMEVAMTQLIQNSVQQDKMEMKSAGAGGLLMEDSTRQEEVKATLKELLECNHEMMTTVQRQLAQQTKLLQQLMKLL